MKLQYQLFRKVPAGLVCLATYTLLGFSNLYHVTKSTVFGKCYMFVQHLKRA